jgi:hypothetical protein
MERGELTGNAGISWAGVKATNAQWLADGTVRVFVQFGMKRHPDLPNVSWIYDYARNDDERAAMNLLFATQEFGRPFVAPAGMAPDLVLLLRHAFDETMADPVFLADAAQKKVDIDPTGGDEIQSIIAEIYRASPTVVARVRAIFAQGTAP